MKRRSVSFALVLFAGWVTSGCAASSGSAEPPRDPESQVGAVYSLMSARAEQGSEAAGPRGILEALPGSALSNQMKRSFSDAVILGNVSAVDEGEAYRVVGGSDSPVPWDSNEVDVLSVYVTLSVDQTLCATQPLADKVTFRFFVNSKDDITTVRDGLEQMGDLAVFVKSAPDTADLVFYPADVTGLLSDVDADGSILWPVARDAYGDKWTDGGESVEALKQACPA